MGAAPQQKSIGRTAAPAPSPPVMRAATAPRLQLAAAGGVKVSKPSDPEEKEAESTAKKVMRMAAPEAAVSRSWESPYTARFAHLQIGRAALSVARKEERAAAADSGFAAELAAAKLSGRPLPDSVKQFMEPRFKADFGKVRIHTGDKAAALNRKVGARAFAFGGQVFFGKDRFQPESADGRELIAHELTHTIQQGAAVQRSEDVTVSHSTPEMVQGSWLSEGLDWVAGKANNIPGFRLFTLIVGVNPINGSSVDRTPANVLRGLIELVPGGGLIVQALDNHKIIDRAAAWFMTQIATVANLAGTLKDALVSFITNLPKTDIVLHPFDTWDKAVKVFSGPIDQAKSFIAGLANGFIELIKDAILRPLGGLAQGLPGYDLLKAVLKKDPVTGDPHPRNADTVIGGFMKLAGKSDVYQKMQEANALNRAWAWFQTAMEELGGFVKEVPALFMKALKSLELVDIILLPLAFIKVGKVFADFVGRFISWGIEKALKLLEIIFDVVSPGAWGYVQKTGAALKSIIQNPLPFLGNLVAAAKLGFSNFGGNFLTHLKNGLIEWLTGGLTGVYIPQALSLQEIVKFVLSILGLTWANIRQKLVTATSETAVTLMEKGFDIVVALVTKGPMAAWEKIKEQLNDLKDMAIGAITDLVVDAVVKKAIPKLISMFIPGAGFIGAIISIYDTIMVFVQKISTIIQVVTGFINSIVAIANGQIGAAAAKVESTLAKLLTLAISFLAGFAGLGSIPTKIKGAIDKIRKPIDKAIDWLIGWIVAGAKKLGKFILQAGVPADPNKRLQLALGAATTAAKALGNKFSKALLQPALAGISARYGLKSINAFEQGGSWWVEAEINPKERRNMNVMTEAPAGEELTEEEARVMLSGAVTRVVDAAAAGAVEDDPKRPGETRPVKPTTTISVSSLGLSEEILYYYIDTSPADAARQKSVSTGVAARIAAAESAKDSHDIYKALQQAAGMVNSLYPKDAKVAVVHHEQRVSESPETFAKTQLERIVIPAAVQKQLDKKISDYAKKMADKYRKKKGMTKAAKKAAAAADVEAYVEELRALIKQSIQDWKNTRMKDAKGKRTAEGQQAAVGPTPLDEIDLIAGSRRGHITVHQMEKK